MKKFFLSFSLMLASLLVFSQGPGLTKSETIDYINNKLSGAMKLHLYIDRRTGSEYDEKYGRDIFQYYTSYLTLQKDGQLIYTYESENASASIVNYSFKKDISYSKKGAYQFDATKIKDIEVYQIKYLDDSPLLYMSIILSNSYCTHDFSTKINSSLSSDNSSETYQWQYYKQNNIGQIPIPVIKDDLEKLKKAILYLRDLLNAEDPFGN